jgi:hypothetical protein
MEMLKNAVKNLLVAEKNMGRISSGKSCTDCTLSQIRGEGLYCYHHEDAGYALQDARQLVIDEAIRLFG